VVRAVFLGCYTDGAGGLGSGIVVARHDPATGALRDPVLAAATPSPSFVAGRGDVLYAVNELDEGTLTAFRVHDDLSLRAGGRLDRSEALGLGSRHGDARGVEAALGRLGRPFRRGDAAQGAVDALRAARLRRRKLQRHVLPNLQERAARKLDALLLAQA